jgi:uncharacterized Ntn-hydrolase superfamily protein
MEKEHLIATYSIVGCDLDAHEWGVAVQSKFLAVGSAVPAAEAKVGAIATQAWANLAYGPDGLRHLRTGASATEVVAALVGNDDGRDHRQVGIVDALGRSATYTGPACLEWAGGRTGDCYAAQGNILRGAETVDALAETFEASTGSPLAERLLASLAAGQAAGGDRRGQQSAALLIVREGGGYGGATDRLVDLRVDDHPTPVTELQRLYGLHQLLFGSTPAAEWLAVDPALRDEIRERLTALGYNQPELDLAFSAWVGTANLEERVAGLDQIDPVVLEALRSQQ